AAIMPVCGTGIYWFGESIIHMPIYAVHGDLDDIVPVQESINMVEAVNRCGGDAKLQILEGVGHDAWNYAYASDELLDWLLSQRRVKDKNAREF
ncbi:MAG: prolyl oligopeptidase family serine peptidase, partial [Clostridia bacterium]|nr:prolyl oligopeptidase family serine peptidase [Clostridia bacterium]